MKIAATLAALALLCTAPLATAQETPAREELPESEIAATIESDSRELLERFVDWAGVISRVRAAFEEQDRDDMSPEFVEWANKALRGLEIEGNRVIIPSADVEPATATSYADMVYQVFYEGPYRDYVFQTLAEQQDALELELQESQLEAVQDFGGDPEQVLASVAALRQERFQLELERAEAQARAGAVEQRLESAMQEREQRTRQVPTGVEALQEAVRAQQAEVERLQEQQKKLGTRDNNDILAAQRRLMDIQQRLQSTQDEWRARQETGGADIANLQNALIETQTHLYGLESRMQVMQQRIQEVERQAQEARRMMQDLYQIEARHRQLQRTMEQVQQGRLFGLSGVPELKFR